MTNLATAAPVTRFCTQPIEVQAVRFTGSAASVNAILNWVEGQAYVAPVDDEGGERIIESVATRDGYRRVLVGCWVLKHADDTFEVLQPQIFTQRFSPVE